VPVCFTQTGTTKALSLNYINSNRKMSMNSLEKKIELFSYLLAYFAIFCVFSIAVLTTADVSSRFILGKSLEGSVEVCEILMVFAAFLGLAWAEITNTHVKVDFLVLKFPTKARLILDIGAKCLTAICLFLISYASFKITFAKYYSGEVAWAGTAQIALWPARLGLAVGFALFCVLSMFKAIRSIQKIRSPKA
jgi:TRAP-type C4-dicarboxylate transport system permease small subunit